MKRWLIVQTRPRWEKKVLNNLVAKGIECYCPLNKVQRQWSDRLKVLHEPLFKSMIFVKINDTDKPAVRTTPGVINFLYRNSKLILLKEKQVQQLRVFIETHKEVLVFGNGAEPVNGHYVNGEKQKCTSIDIDSSSYVVICRRSETASAHHESSQ